jgi:hypothetical protein
LASSSAEPRGSRADLQRLRRIERRSPPGAHSHPAARGDLLQQAHHLHRELADLHFGQP